MLRQNIGKKKHYCVLTFNSVPLQNCSALKTANETMRGHCITRGHSCMVSGRKKVVVTLAKREVTQPKVGRGLDQVASPNYLNLSVSSHLCPCLHSARALFSSRFSCFFRENGGGIRCRRDRGEAVREVRARTEGCDG